MLKVGYSEMILKNPRDILRHLDNCIAVAITLFNILFQMYADTIFDFSAEGLGSVAPPCSLVPLSPGCASQSSEPLDVHDFTAL